MAKYKFVEYKQRVNRTAAQIKRQAKKLEHREMLQNIEEVKGCIDIAFAFLNGTHDFKQNIDKAYYFFKKAAMAGDATAQYITAVLINHHPEIKEDNKSKIFLDFLEKSHQQNFYPAGFLLARVHLGQVFFSELKFTVNNDTKKTGFNILNALSKKMLGILNPSPKVKSETESKLQAEQELNSPSIELMKEISLEIKFSLSKCYLYGLGTEQRADLAELMLGQLVKEKFVPAFCLLGNYLAIKRFKFKDKDKEKENLKKAFDLYEAADKLNCPDAKANLGLCYLYAKGTSKNVERAIKILSDSAEVGNSAAQCELAEIYEKGEYVEQDIKAALENLKKSVEAENVKAIGKLGIWHLEGKWQKKDAELALFYLNHAANHGEAESLFTLGNCYLFGIEVNANPNLAVLYLRAASNVGHQEAKLYLARCYKKGTGVTADRKIAIEMLESLSNEGYIIAKSELSSIYIQDSLSNPGSKTSNELQNIAFSLLKEAEALSGTKVEPGILFNLGMCYFQGLGNAVTQDKSKGIQYFLKIVENSKDKQGSYCVQAGYKNLYKILAECFEKGEGVPPNMPQSIKYLELYAPFDPNCYSKLGHYYLTGKDNPQNGMRALDYFKKGKLANQLDCFHPLALCYIIGIGLKKPKPRKGAELLKEAIQRPELYKLNNTQAIQAPDPLALNNFAWLELYGLFGIEKNPGEAVKKFATSAYLGCKTALLNLAWCRLNGHKLLGVESNLKQIIPLFNDHTLSFEVGQAKKYNRSFGMSYSGFNVHIFPDSKTSEKDRAMTLHSLGLCYLNNWGVPLNYALAFEKFKDAAELGSLDALICLGQCYQNGWGTPKNTEKAVGIFRNIIEYCEQDQNQLERRDHYHALSSTYLALTQLNDEDKEDRKNTAEETAKAIKMLDDASQKGIAIAKAHLAWCYKKGRGGVPVDLARSKKLYTEAADQGNPSSAYALAICFQYGSMGEKIDLNKSLEYYHTAASQGHPDALCNLGSLYETGEGVEKNEKKAVTFYLKAALRNHGPSLYNLARCYEADRGVKSNLTVAYGLYLKAAKQGDSQANEGAERIILQEPKVLSEQAEAEKTALMQLSSDSITLLAEPETQAQVPNQKQPETKVPKQKPELKRKT